MADKTVKVKIDVETDVEPSLKQLRELKRQLKDTAAGSQEFAVLQRQIDDVQDSLVGARAGAGNFADVLGRLPGPIGAIGNQVSGTITALKQFGGLKLNNIQSSFVELSNDVGDIITSFGQLTGITKVYTVLNGFLAKSFVAVGVAEGAAAVGAKAFAAALVTTGIGAIVVALGTLVAIFMQYVDAAENAAKAQKNFNEQREKMSVEALTVEQAALKRSMDLLKSEAKLRGASAKEIFALEQQARNLNLRALERHYNELSSKDSEEGRKTLQSIKNLQTEIKVEDNNFRAGQLEAQKQSGQKGIDLTAQTLKREREEIQKNAKDAFVGLMSEKAKEIFLIEEKFANQIKLATKYGEDTKALAELQQKELSAVTDKYNQIEADKKKVKDEKDKEVLLKAQEDERGILLTGLQARLEELDRKNQLSDLDFQQDLERLAEQRDILAQQEAIDLQNEELTEFQKTEIRKKYADERRAITDAEVATERAAMEAKQQINLAYLGLFEQFGNLLGQIAGKNKKVAIAGVVIQQAAAIGQIIANTSIANAKAVAALPLVGGMPFVAINTISAGLSIASTIAAAAKSIQQINSQPGGSGGSGGTGGGGGAQISAPRVAGISAPQINTGGGMNPSSQIAETLGAAQKPVRAYVVSGDVSSAQALDRRTSRAATFTGG
jgi:hypothetical protein